MKAIWKKLFLPIALLLLIGTTACSHTVPEDAESKGIMSSQELQSPIQQNTISATFPAYLDGENEYNRMVYQTTPFTVFITLPEGWEVRQPEEREQAVGEFFTPLELFQGDEYKVAWASMPMSPMTGISRRRTTTRTFTPACSLAA